MKNNKNILAVLLIAAILWLNISSTYAYGWNWQWAWDGTWVNAEEKSNFVDTNSNWIADWEEDFDNDWILNKDDEDYEWSNENMNDDDGDGIPNKDDEDYEKIEAKDGSNSKSENAWENKNVNSELKAKYKSSFEDKYGSYMEKMSNDQLDTFVSRVDALQEKINTWNYSDSTREKYTAALWALREMAVERIEWEEIDLGTLFE